MANFMTIKLFLLKLECLFCLAISPIGVLAEEIPALRLESEVREKCVNTLRKGLWSSEFWPSIHAAEGLTLGGYGDEVVFGLRPKLAGGFDDQERCGIARELVRAGDKQSVGILLRILAGERSFGHIHAAESLYKVGELGDGKTMRTHFLTTEDLRFKSMTAAALGKAGNADALQFLRSILTHEDADHARTAAWILARIGTPDDIPQLKAGREKVTDELSIAYFDHALATQGDADGIRALVKNLESKDPAVRTYAATFAGDARLISVGPQLIGMLDDEHLDVRVRAAQSLLVLSTPEPKRDPMAILPNASNTVYGALKNHAQHDFQSRKQDFESLRTEKSCKDWQTARKEFFVKQLGGWPEKTPLNAEVTGKLDGGDYRIEKILFESRPRHHVTATLYLPNTKAPYPAVVIACGHTKSGKAADYNQMLGILLAKSGMAAMCYDPIGQGERSQQLTSDGHPVHRGSTTEHFLTGVGSILTGTNTAAFRVWDGIRTIDYLCARDDILADKIGCTGCSGGGTVTSYLMALDDRVFCAAPACYLTTLERLIETIGPQDCEQNIHNQITFGMEQTDYVLMRAPKPTLICSTSGDFFDIDGTWDTFHQAKRFYGLLGKPEGIDIVVTPGKHGITQTGRETIVRWMQRWLLGRDEPITDTGAKLWTPQDLFCTPKGEVLLLPDEKSVYEILGERAQLAKKFGEWKSDPQPEARRQAIRKMLAIPRRTQVAPQILRTVGRREHQGNRVYQFAMMGHDGVEIPVARILPTKSSGDPMLFLTDRGPRYCLTSPTLQKHLQENREVWVMELRGFGELQHPSGSKLLGDWQTSSLAYLMGETLIGHRCDDIARLSWLMQNLTGTTGPISLDADGHAVVTAVHAQFLRTDAVAWKSDAKIPSWTELCSQPESGYPLSETVHGALEIYDLPDLLVEK